MFFSRKEPKGRGIFDIPIAPEEVIRTSLVKFGIAEICKGWLSAKLKVLNTHYRPLRLKSCCLDRKGVLLPRFRQHCTERFIGQLGELAFSVAESAEPVGRRRRGFFVSLLVL